GTYPLPEAQTDRFLLKIKVDYPTLDDEMKIVDLYTAPASRTTVKKQIDANALQVVQQWTRQMPIANDLKKRVLKIIQITRTNKELIEYGASPRASIGLILAAKAHALLSGRNHVSKEDIEAMAYPVLRHRIILNFEAERKGMSTDDAIQEILKKA
ncbi:AAA family ATPase, partial [Candidatus Woesearchaeota archaeon CG_4_10_14_0_8_um_filter_47_5]